MQGNRRKLLQMLAAGAAFYGPWKVNRVWAQSGQKKPRTIGLTMDASVQFGASGQMERLGAMLAIREFNEKGGGPTKGPAAGKVRDRGLLTSSERRAGPTRRAPEGAREVGARR